MAKITIKWATKNDGLGRPVSGFYVHDYGVPIGCACDSRDQAYAQARLYLRDCMKQLQAVGQAMCEAAKGVRRG